MSTFQRTNPISTCLGSISVVFALSGLASSAVLLQWYAGAEKFTAATVVRPPRPRPSAPFDGFAQVNHLAHVQLPRLGYEPIAQAYCLPRALVFWSTLFLAAHVLSAVADVYGLIVRSPAILLALLIVAGLFHVNNILRGSFGAVGDCRGDAGNA